MKTVLNWSSGKDAALAYNLLLQENNYTVTHLLTTLASQPGRVMMHGIPEKMVDLQAERMGLPLKKVYLPTEPDGDYKENMRATLASLQAEGVTYSAFGDIFLEELKAYREQQLATIGMQAVFPLWKSDTRDLITQLEATGIEAKVVCVSEQHLGKEFLGRRVDSQFLTDLPADVDPCGENGEFHTYVYNAPYFSSAIHVQDREVRYTCYSNEGECGYGYYYLDIDAE